MPRYTQLELDAGIFCSPLENMHVAFCGFTVFEGFLWLDTGRFFMLQVFRPPPRPPPSPHPHLEQLCGVAGFDECDVSAAVGANFVA